MESRLNPLRCLLRNRSRVPLGAVHGCIVLLIGLAGAFVLRTTSEGQGTSGATGAADVLAQSALNSILGDLKQEIVAGSNATSITTGAVTTTIYSPKTPVTAVPALSGSNQPLNLLKRSAGNTPFYPASGYDASGSVRAAALSTTGTSQNGRFISLARWNKPLLLPKATPASDTDPTPVTTGLNAFTPPDWILVTRDGSNPRVWNSNLQSSDTNPGSVIGRYAYTIYDEGGLLDINTAGYPTGTKPEQVAYKTSLAYADLTQLTDSSGSPLLAQAQIDSIINWRTTHPFSGRQSLIGFLTQSLATSGTTRAVLENALQYLGTFSRALNQPSIAPDLVNRPALLTEANGGNDKLQSDYARLNPIFLNIRAPSVFTASTPSSAPVDPATGTAARASDGKAPVQGEPYVKHRFPLSRIAWLTHRGPIADDAGTLNPKNDPEIALIIDKLRAAGFTDEFLKRGGQSNIWYNFGLLWESANQRWRYRRAPTGPGLILRLDLGAREAATATREADFFELLKGSESIGSLGKAASKLNATGFALHPYDYQHRIDYDTERQVMQIGANIIDQFDFDGYSTRILFDDGNLSGASNPMEIRGVENHPYFYRTRTGTLIIRNPIPLHVVDNATAPTAANFDSGVGLIMHIPELWNPHDENAPLGDPRPTNFRLVADSVDPGEIPDPLSPNPSFAHSPGLSDLGSYNVFGGMARSAAASGASWSNNSAVTSGYYFSSGPRGSGTDLGYTPMKRALCSGSTVSSSAALNTTLTFNIGTPSSGFSSKLFREPTMLAIPNFPQTGSNSWDISNFAGPNYGNDAYLGSLRNSVNALAFQNGGFLSEAVNPLNPLTTATNQVFTGIVAGFFPIHWVTGSTTRKIWNGHWAQLNVFGSTQDSAPTPQAFLTYRVQYQDPVIPTKWVTYDEKYTEIIYEYLMAAVTDKNEQPYGGLIQKNGLVSYPTGSGITGASGNTWQAWVDPRTSRFGAITASHNIDNAFPPGTAVKDWLDTTNLILPSNRPDGTNGFAQSSSGRNLTSVYPQNFYGLYRNPGFNMDSISFWTGLLTQNLSNTSTYYSDADGVVRRAMGGYVTSGSTPVGLPMAVTSGTGALASQRESRPYILNRPFRSVAELGYVFSGTPWKNLDFSTPESGSAALLDLFCIQDIESPNPVVAGRVNLNTRQGPVLKAILAGAYKDEQNPSVGTISPAEADSIINNPAAGLLQRTRTTPLMNLSDLVGRWVGVSSTSTPIDGAQAYDGPSKDFASLMGSDTPSANIQRFREAPVRALANTGQTRVWNLLIDVIAQSGNYPASAGALQDFVVEGEQRYWMHVAIDRYTGDVLDQSLEAVSEEPTDISSLSILENQPVGTTVGLLSTVGQNSGSTYTYALVSGTGSEGNGAFTISGNTLQTATVLQYSAQNSYHIRVRATDPTGVSVEQPFTISVLQAPYTKWKAAKFLGKADDLSVSGETADPDGDGMPNLMEYALGKSPMQRDSAGITLQNDGTRLRMNYTRSSQATDVTVHACWTDDLTKADSWRTTGVNESLLSDDGTLQQWQASIPAGAGRKIFMRLVITKP